mmetsp:Transcript_5393/g.21282  ORF Transcript_5393/g.21282 Transcript_5393/m.21282 type:complete len:219 (-) Transcript_5393:270-926(-)
MASCSARSAARIASALSAAAAAVAPSSPPSPRPLLCVPARLIPARAASLALAAARSLSLLSSNRSDTSIGSPMSTLTVLPTRGTFVRRGCTCCMPSCTYGTISGATPPLRSAASASQPTPRLARVRVAPPSRDRVPSGKMCTHSPSARRSRISRMPAWSAPAPRSTGTALPAAKKQRVKSVRKQFSAAHSVQRIRSAVSSRSAGTSVDGMKGSSRAAT